MFNLYNRERSLHSEIIPPSLSGKIEKLRLLGKTGFLIKWIIKWLFSKEYQLWMGYITKRKKGKLEGLRDTKFTQGVFV